MVSVRFLALILVGLIGSSQAQAESDNLLWTSAGVRARVAKRLKAEVSMQSRYDNNASEIESLIPEVELALVPLKWFELAAGLRTISQRSKSGDREPANRVHVQGSLEHELGPVELSYRLRYQSKHELDEEELAERIRNRIQVQFDTDTLLTPLLAAELFTDHVADPVEHKKVRLTAGTAIKLSRAHRLKLKLHHQADIGDEDIERIVSLDYRFNFPKK